MTDRVQVAIEPEAVRIPEVARIMGVGRTKAQELVDSGELISLKVGACRLVRTDRIRDYLRTQEAEQLAAKGVRNGGAGDNESAG